MSEWATYTISEVCRRFSSGKGITASQIFEIGAYPVFGGNGIRGYTDTYNFEGECAIIGRQGAYCGNTKYFCGKAYMTEHAIVATANDEHNIGYIANLLSIMNLGQYQGQSAQPGLSVNTLSKIELKLPDKKTQDSIFSLLSALDKKIALNKQINARLEEMAKTLYDYWFVQFDFPNANGKPYKSSGGEMVFDETLKREIPKGWEVKSLGEVITHSTTGLNPRDNFSLGNGENFYVTIKNIKDNEIKFHTCAKITDEALNVINKRSKLDKGDILFTSIEPIGSTYLLHEKPKNWDINESVFSIRSKSDFITPYFLFMLLSSDEIKSFTRQVSTGSVHKGIRHESLKRFTFAYSGIDLIKNFTNLISPMQQNIFFLQKQNHHLTQLRDFLLPMLMNGQVSVAE